MKKKVKKTKKIREATRDQDQQDSDAKVVAAETRGRPATVNYENFVRLWKKAGSVSEVAAAFNIKTTSASAIANRLRKAGVTELRRFPRRGAQAIDVKALNRIAAGKTD